MDRHYSFIKYIYKLSSVLNADSLSYSAFRFICNVPALWFRGQLTKMTTRKSSKRDGYRKTYTEEKR